MITVLLLAFLVLLLVALAALTRVETQVASNTQDLAQARQNALLALNIALGELQKAAGPDQRTTAPAALGEGATAVMAANAADNGLGTPVDGTRHWTGVWGNKNTPESLFTGAPGPVLLQWLVSGNEATAPYAAAGDGHITAPTAAAVAAFRPSQPVTLADGGALSASAPATASLRIGSRPAALLMGAASAGDDVAGFVAAPLVDVSSTQAPGQSGPVRVGRYAWWVGDEGVKAKYNLPDPYIANAVPDSDPSPESRDSRYRALAAQRNGIERIAPFVDDVTPRYPIASTLPEDALYLGVGRTITNAGMRLVSTAVNPVELRKSIHDLTTYSYGVLADSHFGGLRRDLTFHLDPRSGDTFLDGRNILPDGATPTSTFPGSRYAARPSLFSESAANGGMGHASLNLSPRLGPKWDQLKSFYRMAYDHPGDLEVQPAVDIDANPVKVQAGISPVILDARTLFVLRAGPSIDTAVIFVLGNPYTRPLKASAGVDIRMSLHPNRYQNGLKLDREWGLVCSYIDPESANPRYNTSVFKRPGGNAAMPVTPAQRLYESNPEVGWYYPLLKYAPTADGPADPGVDYPGVLDNVVFRIPPGVLDLEPGEAKAYTLASSPDLSEEVIDGKLIKVKELRAMTDSSAISYFTHVCQPFYVSDAALFPAGLLTGSPPPAGSGFKWKAIYPDESGVDYTLTVSGKPRSVLQQAGPFFVPNWSGQVSISETPFSEEMVITPGVRHARVFQNPLGESYSGESLLANQAETNLLGAFQSLNIHASGQGNTHLVRHLQSRYSTEVGFNANFDTENATQAAWGQGHAGNPFLLSPRGRWVIADAPAAHASDEVPLLSLGQLQHADLTADDEALGTALQAGNPFGNSRYSRLVPRAASRTDLISNSRSQRFSNQNDNSATALGDSPRWYAGYVPDLPKNTQVRRYDLSYLLNTALWDATYFSTVRPAAGSDGTVAPLPANRRLSYTGLANPTLGQLRAADSSDAIPDPSALAPDEVGRSPAAQLLINGAFNINSTSEKAWIAVLSSQRGLGLNHSPATPALTPFARSIRQPGGVQLLLPPATDPAATAAKAADNTYIGFRGLTDPEIATLAAEIVKQVRARGPFLSLAQFVNRQLTAGAETPVGDTSLAGALQQAIDRALINATLNYNSSLPRATAARANAFPDNAVMPTGNTSGLSTYMGVPGWLTQADVLQALAPALAARSDTFVIRAYGEATDPVNSPAAPAEPVVKGRAWCEAVVQRMPEYIDGSDRPTLSPPHASALNQAFGRRFRIVSFRWLSSNDI